MKKTSLLGLFCMSVMLGLALIGGPSAQSQESSAESVNVAPVSETNTPQGNALPAEIDPNGAFGKLVRLVLAGVEEGVILTYIDNTLRLFNLDADDIIYLTDLGAPAEVIKAAMEHDQRLIQKGISPEAAPVESVAEESVGEQPPEVTEEYFYERLSPYGAWVHVDGYGRCWRPTVAVYNTGWQPYCDNGRWIYTSNGWYWRSGYSWGSAAFHYGRWFRHSRYGWCWWPDTVWAPSWVCWRYDRSHCGWAPLPPYTVYRSGIGIVYRNSRVEVGYDFGLSVSSFTFVATKNFYDPKPWRHRIHHRDAEHIYNRTKVFQKINYDRKNRSIINSGIPPREITAVTRQEIRPVSIRHAQGGVASGRNHKPGSPNGHAQSADRPSHVSAQKTAPLTTHRNIQQSNRAAEQGNSRKSTQVPQRKPEPYVAPRSQERKNVVVPQKRESNGSSRGQVQSNRSKPKPEVKQSRPAKIPPPAQPAKARGKEKQKPQREDSSQ